MFSDELNCRITDGIGIVEAFPGVINELPLVRELGS